MSIRILYVDDEPDIREVAEMSLQLEPSFDVRTVGSGSEALDVARSWQPDLILLDVMMPVMDGPATLLALREEALTAKLPVVFITARTQPHDVKRLMELGALGVIAKPFDPMQLSAHVLAHLEKARGG